MPTPITCPSCGTTYQLPTSLRGSIPCEKCGQELRISEPGGEITDARRAGAVTAHRRWGDDDWESRPGPYRRQRETAGAGAAWWILGGVCLLVLLLGGIVALFIGGVYWLGVQVSNAAAMNSAWAMDDEEDDALMPCPDDADVVGAAPFAVDPKLHNADANDKVFVTDMTGFDVRSGPIGKNGRLPDPANAPIKVDGVRSPHGLSMHPPRQPDYSRVRYALGGQAKRFQATVAFNDDRFGETWGRVIFVVLGDGKVLWSSAEIAERGQSEECSIDVSNVNVLELRVVGGALHPDTHAVWVEPCVVKAGP